jgi:hypothetical protein
MVKLKNPLDLLQSGVIGDDVDKKLRDSRKDIAKQKTDPLGVRPKNRLVDPEITFYMDDYMEQTKINEEEGYYLSISAIIIIVIGFLCIFVMLIRYANFVDTPEIKNYFDLILISVSFLCIGIVLFFVGITINNQTKKFTVGLSLSSMGIALGIAFISWLIQSLFLNVFSFSLAGIDFLMFYTVMAIAEEMLFRAGFQVIIIVTWNKAFRGRFKIAGRLIAITLCSFIFMIAHSAVYGNISNPLDLNPYMLSLFAVSWVYGASFEFMKTKKIEIPLIAHVLNNVFYSISKYGVGFT